MKALFIFAGSLIFFSCKENKTNTLQQENNFLADSFSSITKVKTYVAKKAIFNYTINTNGKIIANQILNVTSQTNGVIKIWNVKTGNMVTKGSILLKIDDSPFVFKIEKAQQILFNSRNEYESRLLGYENLFKNKSNDDVNLIKRKLLISSGVAAAENELKEAQYELSKCIVYAQFSGILSDVNVSKDYNITIGQNLFKIYNPQDLCLEVKVLENDIGLLKNGVTASLYPIGNENNSFQALVDNINPYVDENGMVVVKLKINLKANNKKDFNLLPGMSCIASIMIPFPKTLIIPKEAVVYRGEKAVVFTYENGKAIWNYISVGRDNGKTIEVTHGLAEGQLVITTNNLQLSNDAPVSNSSYETKKTKELQ
jgi:RND family efflux transporter MFP subunit